MSAQAKNDGPDDGSDNGSVTFTLDGQEVTARPDETIWQVAVRTASERARRSRALVFELLVADQPDRATSPDPEAKFWHWAEALEVTESRFPGKEGPVDDASHPAMRVHLDACITGLNAVSGTVIEGDPLGKDVVSIQPLDEKEGLLNRGHSGFSFNLTDFDRRNVFDFIDIKAHNLATDIFNL